MKGYVYHSYKNEFGKISCLEELKIRIHCLEQVLYKVCEVQRMLEQSFEGEAVVVFEGEGATHINLIESRLKEQREGVYEELDDLDNHSGEMCIDIDSLYNDLIQNRAILKGFIKQIEEGSTLKEFVARGREC